MPGEIQFYKHELSEVTESIGFFEKRLGDKNPEIVGPADIKEKWLDEKEAVALCDKQCLNNINRIKEHEKTIESIRKKSEVLREEKERLDVTAPEEVKYEHLKVEERRSLIGILAWTRRVFDHEGLPYVEVRHYTRDIRNNNRETGKFLDKTKDKNWINDNGYCSFRESKGRFSAGMIWTLSFKHQRCYLISDDQIFYVDKTKRSSAEGVTELQCQDIQSLREELRKPSATDTIWKDGETLSPSGLKTIELFTGHIYPNRGRYRNTYETNFYEDGVAEMGICIETRLIPTNISRIQIIEKDLQTNQQDLKKLEGGIKEIENENRILEIGSRHIRSTIEVSDEQREKNKKEMENRLDSLRLQRDELQRKIEERQKKQTNIEKEFKENEILYDMVKKMLTVIDVSSALTKEFLLQLEKLSDPENEQFLDCLEDVIPERYLCPIDQTLMNDPLRTLCGHSFDLKSVDRLFHSSAEGQVNCPCCQAVIKPKDLSKNFELESEIKEWKKAEFDKWFNPPKQKALEKDEKEYQPCSEFSRNLKEIDSSFSHPFVDKRGTFLEVMLDEKLIFFEEEKSSLGFNDLFEKIGTNRLEFVSVLLQCGNNSKNRELLSEEINTAIQNGILDFFSQSEAINKEEKYAELQFDEKDCLAISKAIENWQDYSEAKKDLELALKSGDSVRAKSKSLSHLRNVMDEYLHSQELFTAYVKTFLVDNSVIKPRLAFKSLELFVQNHKKKMRIYIFDKSTEDGSRLNVRNCYGDSLAEKTYYVQFTEDGYFSFLVIAPDPNVISHQEVLIQCLSRLISRTNEILVTIDKRGMYELNQELGVRLIQISGIASELKNAHKTSLVTQIGQEEKRLSSFKWQPLMTMGKGDCPFHVFGTWNQKAKMYICSDVVDKRQQVQLRIQKAVDSKEENKEDDRIRELAIAGIKELVMSGRAIGEKTAILLREYKNYLSAQDELAPQIWQNFETELKKHDVVMEYIKKHGGSDGQKELREMFYDALNKKEGELYARILSIPALNKAFHDYNMLRDVEFGWQAYLQADAIKEYAAFFGKLEQWLLPHELEIIAVILKVTVILSPYPNAAPQLLNGGQLQTIRGQFDGISHYERVGVRMSPLLAAERRVGLFDQIRNFKKVS